MRNSQQEILGFWFEEISPSLWFQNNPEFSATLKDRFFLAYEMARDGLCSGWKSDAKGCLALCVLLDQFPRIMFRDAREAFATDDKALLTAKHAVSKGFDQLVTPAKRRFLYLPYQHSEKLVDQRKSVEFFTKMERDDPLGKEYALRNLAVIEEFGRFPQRNAILGRENTPQEAEYLAHGAAGF